MKKVKKAIAGLPPGIGVSKIDNGQGGMYWRIRLGKRFTGGGVVTRHFAQLDAARDWIFGDAEKEKAAPGSMIDLKKDAGAVAFGLTATRLNEAADAFKRLGPFSLSLPEAITIALRHSRPKAGALTFEDAIPLFLKAPRSRPLGIETAKSYRNSINLLSEDFPRKKAHEVTQADILDFIDDDSWEPATAGHHLRNVRVFYGWAVRTGHSGINPTDGVPEPIDDKEPIAFSATETARLLSAASQFPSMTASIALGLFGGLRTSEIRRLDWSEIGETEIEIKPAKTKTRRRRMVSICDSLQTWLAPYRQTSGSVAPEDWRSGFEDVISAAGYQVGQVVDGKPKPAWPRNAMRHSFGTFHFAAHHNETLTAAEMGNSPTMVFAHYRRVVPAAETEKFWKLLWTDN